MKFEAQFALQGLNTLGVPSTAEYFFAAETEEDLVDALAEAEKRDLEVHILAGGSNVLLPETITGLVLQPSFCGIELVQDHAESVVVKVKAANDWHRFVCHCLAKGYYGLENLSLIPGAAGAAPIQNIGAYGVELCQYVYAVDAYDRQNRCFVSLSAEDCEFAYRDSVFKSRSKQRYIILAVQFKLSKRPRVNIEYPALNSYFAQKSITPSPELVARAVIEIRQNKLPQPEVIPNAGSFFKNPLIDKQHFLRLKKEYPAIVAFESGSAYKVAAAWLLDRAGWKGKSRFDIQLHHQQALVLTNPRRAPLKNILQFANLVKVDIQQRFGIVLEIEPQILGEQVDACR